VEAMREFAIGTGAEFTREELATAIIAKYPELEPKLKGVSTALINMASRGELIRSGSGRSARYQRSTKLRPPSGAGISEKEARYREFRSTIKTEPRED